MTTKPNADAADTPTDDFEAALRSLVLESFARGATVRGTWEFVPSSSLVPGWRVTIEKVGDADPPEDEAVFLDE